MPKNNPTPNKGLTIALAALIIVAVAVVIYVNLPQESPANQDGNNVLNETPEVNLTISYGEQTLQYTFDDIEKMQSTSGTARYLKASPFFSSGTIIINPPMNESANQYTGVKIAALIENIENLSETYNVTLSAPDGYNTTFNSTEINGYIMTYNETGNGSIHEVSVILAYKQDGEYLSEDNGPLMVAIVGDESISLSNKWVSNVVDIEITE